MRVKRGNLYIQTVCCIVNIPWMLDVSIATVIAIPSFDVESLRLYLNNKAPDYQQRYTENQRKAGVLLTVGSISVNPPWVELIILCLWCISVLQFSNQLLWNIFHMVASGINQGRHLREPSGISSVLSLSCELKEEGAWRQKTGHLWAEWCWTKVSSLVSGMYMVSTVG